MESMISEFGVLSISYYWAPLLIWSAISLLTIALFHLAPLTHQVRLKRSSYQFLLFALPVGMLSVFLRRNWSAWVSESNSDPFIETGLYTIPLPAIGVSGGSAVDSYGPEFYIGVVTATVLVITMFCGFRLFIRIIHTRAVTNGSMRVIKDQHLLYPYNQIRLNNLWRSVAIASHPTVETPVTYGIFRPVILLPEAMLEERDKCNMAIRHELAHISQFDYLYTLGNRLITYLFWFQPLLHYISGSIEELNELTCDRQVVEEVLVSKKEYAHLLLEQAQHNPTNRMLAIHMASRQSPLIQRVRSMTTSTHHKSSKAGTLLSGFIILVLSTMLIACTDVDTINDVGPDAPSAESLQKISSGDSQPLFVIDDKEFTYEEGRKKLATLNPSMIKSLQVLRAEAALKSYGSAGKDGVIIITLKDDSEATGLSHQDEEGSTTAWNITTGASQPSPVLIGGLEALQQSITYPKQAKSAGIEGRVYVAFTISPSGEVLNPVVKQGIGFGCDEEAIKAVQQASFKPAMNDGKPIKTEFTMPVVFKL